MQSNSSSISNWIAQNLEQKPEPQILLSDTVSKLDDYALAYLYNFHLDQSNRAVLNAIILQHHPELESPLFNHTFIQHDFEYHDGLCTSLIEEIERRII